MSDRRRVVLREASTGGRTEVERTAEQPTHSSGAVFHVIVVIILGMIFLAGILLFPLNETWGIHVASGAFFPALTIEILDRLIESRERRRKEPLKRELISEIGRMVSTILRSTLYLVGESKDYPYGTEAEFHSMLKELAERKDIKLGTLVNLLIHPEPEDHVGRFQLQDELFEPAEELGKLGTKALGVLEPPLCASLLKIRDIIRRIRSDYYYTEATGGYEDDFIKKRLRGEVSAILKLLHSIDEMKIPLYDLKTD